MRSRGPYVVALEARVRQTVLVVLGDASARQQALNALRAAPDLLPAAARSLQHALDVLDEMRVDLLLLDPSASKEAATLTKLDGVPSVRLSDLEFDASALVETVRAAMPTRTSRRVRPAS